MNWNLLRVWHVEVLSSVAGDSRANTFTRTSYGLVPDPWRKLSPGELQRRVEMVLEGMYRRRNYFSAQSGDPAEMWWIGYAFEWVTSESMPADDRVREDVYVRSVVSLVLLDEKLIEDAIAVLESQWRVDRPGIEARPWGTAFSAFSVDADGESWKTLRNQHSEASAAFDEHFAMGAR